MEAAWQTVHKFPLTPPAKGFAPRGHRGQRDDNGWETEPGNESAVDRTETGAHADSHESNDRHWPPFGRREGRHDAAPGKLRADGDIDLPGDNDERDARGREQDWRGGGGHGQQLARFEEIRRRQRQDGEQKRQRNPYRYFAQMRSHGVVGSS